MAFIFMLGINHREKVKERERERERVRLRAKVRDKKRRKVREQILYEKSILNCVQ